jgi:Cu(I)/Ag(I) efflux system membrane fusion protein
MKKRIYITGFNNSISLLLQFTLSLAKGTLLRSIRYSAIAAILIVFVASCKSKSDTPKDPDVYYTCSMDPQVVEYKPGKCPICKMELTQVKKSKSVNPYEIQLSENQMKLGNIQVDTVNTGNIGDKMYLTATLNFDLYKSTSVSSRVMGRIENLYFKNLGDYVRKGDKLFDIYSEELNNAKQEYLLALERKQTLDNSLIDFNQLLQSAKNKLLLWGLTETQIEELAASKKAMPLTSFYSPVSGYITTLDIKEGSYAMEGGTIVRLADMSTLWAEAQVYTSQMAALDKSGNATVQIPDMPEKQFTGRIEFVNPEINPDTRINLIRVAIPNTGHQLKPGMPAYVIIKGSQRNTLYLPLDAVLRDGQGATVWVKSGKTSFVSKMVATGIETEEGIEIKSGLQPGDIVVIQGAYLLQSEYKFKKGANPMEGHNM